MLASTLATLILPLAAAAQLNAPSPTGASSGVSAPPSTAGNVNVNVGSGGGWTFSPANINAPVGTLVTFYFSGTRHSVTQSTFAAPCTYLRATGTTPAGFDSGLQSNVQFTLNVTDSQPIYFYCKEGSHCVNGMVGAINAPSSGNTFEAFQSAARAVRGQATEPDNGPVTGGVGAVATAAPAATALGNAGTTTSGSMKVTARAGVAILAMGIVALLA